MLHPLAEPTFKLERFVAELRSLVASRLWRLLVRAVTDFQRRQLDERLTPAEGSRRSREDAQWLTPIISDNFAVSLAVDIRCR